VGAPPGLYVTEMVTSRALVKENERTLEMVRPDPAERVRSLQLYGVDPAVMAKAATMLIERDLTDHIDLNFGCPVPKVTKKGGGAALPWKRDLFTDLVGAVVRASNKAGERAGREIPVTVKIRIGIDSEHETATDAALAAQKLADVEHEIGQTGRVIAQRPGDALLVPAGPGAHGHPQGLGDQADDLEGAAAVLDRDAQGEGEVLAGHLVHVAGQDDPGADAVGQEIRPGPRRPPGAPPGGARPRLPPPGPVCPGQPD